MTKFEWCREFFDSREEAAVAKYNYDKQGYATSEIESITEIDEKHGEVNIVYELLVSYNYKAKKEKANDSGN